jgi:hypothetical protein
VERGVHWRAGAGAVAYAVVPLVGQEGKLNKKDQKIAGGYNEKYAAR